jgi:hypothetical protein
VTEAYKRYLKKDGIFITSLYKLSKRANSIRERLMDKYLSLDEVEIIDRSKIWVCSVLVPMGITTFLDL